MIMFRFELISFRAHGTRAVVASAMAAPRVKLSLDIQQINLYRGSITPIGNPNSKPGDHSYHDSRTVSFGEI